MGALRWFVGGQLQPGLGVWLRFIPRCLVWGFGGALLLFFITITTIISIAIVTIVCGAGEFARLSVNRILCLLVHKLQTASFRELARAAHNTAST